MGCVGYMGRMTPRRGDIFLGNVEQQTGIKKLRTMLIIQNDTGNRYSKDTIIAVIRHETEKRLVVNVPVSKGVAGLTKDCVVDCGYLATITKDTIRKYIGHLPMHYMDQVNRALKISLELD